MVVQSRYFRLLLPPTTVRLQFTFADFVRTPGPPHISEVKVAHYFSWGEVIIRVLAFCVPAQPATLGYEITG